MPLRHLLDRNREWAARMEAERPGFFTRLSEQQTPRYMWIGCSDSRVPANQIAGLDPGEVFVHRNVANVVVHSDLNCLSTVQFAVERLKVQHVIVCGHYGCSGVQAALEGARIGLADNWLRHVQDVRDRHRNFLTTLAQDVRMQARKLCELNVIEQVANVCLSTVVQDAWARGQTINVHGWVYGIEDGLIKDLHMRVNDNAGLESAYAQALALIMARAPEAA
jgi:carbonic anhydrase